MFQYKLMIVAGLVTLPACNVDSVAITQKSKPNVELEKSMSTTDPIKTLVSEDRNDPRTQIPIKPEQLVQLTERLKTSIRIIAGEVKLSDVDSLFGIGEDTSPKGPGAKLVRFYVKDIVGKKTTTLFTRRENNTVWYQADLGETPENHPKGVYLMNLTAGFFNGMTLLNSYTTKPSNPRDKHLPRNIFEFQTMNTTAPVKVIFNARSDVSSLEDKFPKSFTFVEITKFEK